MNCINCHTEIEDIFIYCNDCQDRKDIAIIKAQIKLMERMATYTDDPDQLQEIFNRREQYIRELQDGTL